MRGNVDPGGPVRASASIQRAGLQRIDQRTAEPAADRTNTPEFTAFIISLCVCVDSLHYI